MPDTVDPAAAPPRTLAQIIEDGRGAVCAYKAAIVLGRPIFSQAVAAPPSGPTPPLGHRVLGPPDHHRLPAAGTRNA